jgi:hypothetical protein
MAESIRHLDAEACPAQAGSVLARISALAGG